MSNLFEPVIGLEIHVELATKAKMFCQCDASWQTYEPNTNTCPVCLGMPGALPVPNRKAVEYTIKIAQALGCTINKKSHFDRKHYFYPDLPKGYQISQYDEPIGIQGSTEYRVQSTGKYEIKRARIHRVHLEEDTGKLIHKGEKTLVDFNRSGVPLVEIVTEPDFHTSEDVKAFLQSLHTIITYLGVSEADMEKGSMRLEPNISVKSVDSRQSIEGRSSKDEGLPPYKVEVKNINSFNFVKRAVDYEVIRQTAILEKGEIPAQETRGWDEAKQATYTQRSKEEAHDYRYFPEPDIPPMEFDDALLEQIRETIPELPGAKVGRFVKDFGLKNNDAFLLTRNSDIADLYERVLNEVNSRVSRNKEDDIPQKVANFVINKLKVTNTEIETFDKSNWEKVVNLFLDTLKPKQTDMGVLTDVVKKVLEQNEKSVADYKAGKTNAIMYLVGQVMKEMRGGADANIVKSALLDALKV